MLGNSPFPLVTLSPLDCPPCLLRCVGLFRGETKDNTPCKYVFMFEKNLNASQNHRQISLVFPSGLCLQTDGSYDYIV